MNGAGERPDFREIARLVAPGSRVIDVGCGAGELLETLARERGVDGRGLEISPEGVAHCLARGLCVAQGDADRDLDFFAARAFDYAILSQTLQTVVNPRHVLGELLRIGAKAIVSAPNFGHWRARFHLFFRGRMPVTRALPDPWWSTPNIHLSTLADFAALCDDMGLTIEACAALAGRAQARRIDPRSEIENWRAESAIFVLSR